MTEPGPDQQFFDIADAMIRAANAQCDHAPANKVSAATLFAAARFNAFAAAAAAPTAQELADRRESIVGFLVQQYTQMLHDNLAEYERHLQQLPQKDRRTTDQLSAAASEPSVK